MTPDLSPLRRPLAIAGALAAFLLLPLPDGNNRKLRRFMSMLSIGILIATLASMGMIGCGGDPTTPNGTGRADSSNIPKQDAESRRECDTLQAVEEFRCLVFARLPPAS